MNRSKTFISISAAVAMLIARGAASSAAELLFAPDGGPQSGSIETAIPLDRVGTAPLQRGRLLVNGDRAQVSIIPEWQFDRHVVLSGKVLDTRYHPESNSLQSIIFFNNGAWLNYFNDPTAVETVFTDQEAVSGRITSITTDSITLARPLGTEVQLPLANVTRVQSPRVFTLSFPIKLTAEMLRKPLVLNVGSAVLSPPQHVFKMHALRQQIARLENDGDVPTKRLVLEGTLLSLTNLSQAAPVMVLPLATHGLKHQMLLREFNALGGPLFGLPPPH